MQGGEEKNLSSKVFFFSPAINIYFKRIFYFFLFYCLTFYKKRVKLFP